MRRGALREKAIAYAFVAAGSASILVVGLIILFLFKEAIPFVREPGLQSLFGTKWVPTSMQREQYGLGPLVAGSFVITLLATLLAIPVGVCGAAYTAEIAAPKEREFLKPFVELLAAIPSVVLGYFGLVILAPLVKQVFGLSSGLTGLTGALLLALMAIPTIVSISEDAIRSVPQSYREASSALGATAMQTLWRVTIPAALPGITAAVMLGMGRVVGETMAVLMVTGNAAIMTVSPLESMRTMTATIAAEMGEVTYGSPHYQALFWVGIVLMAATLALNLMALAALHRRERP